MPDRGGAADARERAAGRGLSHGLRGEVARRDDLLRRAGCAGPPGRQGGRPARRLLAPDRGRSARAGVRLVLRHGLLSDDGLAVRVDRWGPGARASDRRRGQGLPPRSPLLPGLPAGSDRPRLRPRARGPRVPRAQPGLPARARRGAPRAALLPVPLDAGRSPALLRGARVPGQDAGRAPRRLPVRDGCRGRRAPRHLGGAGSRRGHARGLHQRQRARDRVGRPHATGP